MQIKIEGLFSLEHTIAAKLLKTYTYPWEVLANIESFIMHLGPTLPKSEFEQVDDGVWIARDANVFESAFIGNCLIIDHEAEIRHCAFLRQNGIIGKGAVVGNSSEIKNAILFDEVQAPHFNYVGDSILGYRSHMGAGSITSNLKSDKSCVAIKMGNEKIDTGMKKIGAMLGDNVEIGCNSVLCPGAIIGQNTHVYPLSLVRGVISENCLYKDANNIVEKY